MKINVRAIRDTENEIAGGVVLDFCLKSIGMKVCIRA